MKRDICGEISVLEKGLVDGNELVGKYRRFRKGIVLDR